MAGGGQLKNNTSHIMDGGGMLPTFARNQMQNTGGQMRPQGSAIADARASGITGIASGNEAAKHLTAMSSGQDIGTRFHNQLPGSPMSGGKGGGNGEVPKAMPAPAPSTQYSPMAAPAQAPAQPQGFNVNQAAAGGLQQAMLGTQQAMGFRPQSVRPVSYQAQTANAAGYSPSAMTSQGYASTGPTATGYGASTVGTSPTVSAQNVQAGQLARTNLGAYTNPFESQVVDQALGDIERSRNMAQNQLGAQATASNAYGGSRQGIAEAETNRAFAEQAARTASGLRQAGFTQAQQMAQQDIGTAQQAALANQQANLAAGTTTAGFGQQSNLANQAASNVASQFGASAQNLAAQQAAAAQNQAAQFGSSAANQAAAANMAAQNQAAQFGSGAANQMALSNQAALNQAGQFGATQSMSAQLANQAAAAQANQQRLGASAQMGALGQQAFGTGQAIQQQQAQQGLLQQGIQQALIDAARQQYAGYTGAPQAALNAPLSALGVAQQGAGKTTTDNYNPGLMSYIQAAAQMCWVAREVYGEQDPKWMQFREWVIGHSPDWFYKAYSNYGEKFAKVVRKVPAIKVILRPFMDAKRKSIGYKA
jgi:hypothetical protein